MGSDARSLFPDREKKLRDQCASRRCFAGWMRGWFGSLAAGGPTPSGADVGSQTPPRVVMIEYPFPVNEGRDVALIRVPKYLSRSDADRLVAFVRTLVIEAERGD